VIRRLTPALSASGQNVSVQIKQSPTVAAMRCRAGLGVAFCPTDPCLLCFLSLCSCHFGFHAVPSALRFVRSWLRRVVLCLVTLHKFIILFFPGRA
jgi:hypothetical protein